MKVRVMLMVSVLVSGLLGLAASAPEPTSALAARSNSLGRIPG
ncbi:MAG TPA: hypothetical protein VKZ96_14340 [Thermomicrobiales bacterium]|nr:hypothetical protein [Thermomicrobiales bacterium]